MQEALCNGHAAPAAEDETPAPPRPIVVKVGGRHVDNDAGAEALAQFALEQRRNADGAPLVIVHGGGDETQALHDALGVACRKVDGLRVTSDESMPLVTMTLRGLVNTRLVAAMHRRGVRAMGVSGVDMGLMRAERLDEERFGRVGDSPEVDAETLLFLLRRCEVLIVAPVCMGDDGSPVNVNADTCAEAVAAALSAASLDFVTDVPGVLDEGRTVRRIDPTRCIRLVERGVIQGGMLPKSEAARRALREGVARVRIGTMASLANEEATEFIPGRSRRIAGVRTAQPDEAEAISALLSACAPRCVARSASSVRGAIDDHHVALDETGRIIGCVMLHETDDGIELRGLAVDERARSLGVGKALMRRADDMQERSGLDIACVTCEPAFFERFGFEVDEDAELPPRPDERELGPRADERVRMRREAEILTGAA